MGCYDEGAYSCVMRSMMTIPFLVMIGSAFMWFVATAPVNDEPWWKSWVADVCRILFAAATLVTLWGLMNRPLS